VPAAASLRRRSTVQGGELRHTVREVLRGDDGVPTVHLLRPVPDEAHRDRWGTPALSRFPTAVRRRSCGISFSPARLHAPFPRFADRPATLQQVVVLYEPAQVGERHLAGVRRVPPLLLLAQDAPEEMHAWSCRCSYWTAG
jgi:hypothetical protein